MIQIFVRASVLIQAEPERVFSFLSNLDRHLLWVSGLTDVTESGPLSVGLTYQSRNTAVGIDMPGKHEVLRLEPGVLVEIGSVHGSLSSKIRYLTERSGSGTNVVCEFEASSPHVVFGLAKPLVESLTLTRIEADLATLKVFVDAESKQGRLDIG